MLRWSVGVVTGLTLAASSACRTADSGQSTIQSAASTGAGSAPLWANGVFTYHCKLQTQPFKDGVPSATVKKQYFHVAGETDPEKRLKNIFADFDLTLQADQIRLSHTGDDGQVDSDQGFFVQLGSHVQAGSVNYEGDNSQPIVVPSYWTPDLFQNPPTPENVMVPPAMLAGAASAKLEITWMEPNEDDNHHLLGHDCTLTNGQPATTPFDAAALLSVYLKRVEGLVPVGSYKGVVYKIGPFSITDEVIGSCTTKVTAGDNRIQLDVVTTVGATTNTQSLTIDSTSKLTSYRTGKGLTHESPSQETQILSLGVTTTAGDLHLGTSRTATSLNTISLSGTSSIDCWAMQPAP